MKRIIYILASLLPLMTGCTKPNSSVTPEEFDRYIFFSQGIDTKASLIESANTMGKFGVVGFKYDDANDNTWAKHQTSNPTPNVFYNDQGSLVFVEELECSSDGSGSSTYTPLQGWSNISKYAFFAYYPIDKGNVTLVNTDGSAYTGGTPAIKYTMTSEDIKDDMADVMIAQAHTDKYWYSASETNLTGNDIKFSFQHCLSSLGLHIKNSTSGTVTLNSAKIKVEGLVHQDVIIPLDGSARTFGSPISGAKEYTMTVQPTETTLTSIGMELTDKMILIPQSEDATITVTLEYTRSADGYTTYEGSFTTAVKTALNEGIKHLVYLNFTDSNVEVKQGSGAWVEVPEVGNTFN